MADSKIIYNVTVQVDTEIVDDWLSWMKETHIPDVMATGMFESYQISRIIKDSPDGISYAVQYICQDMKTLHQYQVHHAQKLQAEYKKRYDGKYVAFRTLMEIVASSSVEK